MRRAATLLILTGAALVFTGAAPEEHDTMLEQFDRVLTAMAYAAAGLAVFAIVWAGFVLMAEGGEERAGAERRAPSSWRWSAWCWCCRPRASPPC